MKTVESYQAHIKEKLALQSSRDLVQRAIEWRLGETGEVTPPTRIGESPMPAMGDSPKQTAGPRPLAALSADPRLDAIRTCRSAPSLPSRAVRTRSHVLRSRSARSPDPSRAWKERLCLPPFPTAVSPRRPPAVSDIHVLWLTAGLGCDGDSVSITAATQPSIEDVLLGAIPGLPKVHLHNPVLAVEVGDEFLKSWYQAKEGKLDPFVLVVEGSIPNEKIKKEGYWAAMGTDVDDPAADHDQHLDRLAGAQGAGGRRHRHLRHLRRHPRDGRAIPPAPWAWPTTWAGTGGRRRACRS